MADLKILSARDLDKMATSCVEPFACKEHLRRLVASWDGNRRLVVLWCPSCPVTNQDRVAVRVG